MGLDLEPKLPALPLAGRVALTTGGGRGIGRATALALAEAGADVFLTGRSEAAIERVAAEVRDHGRAAGAAPADVTDPGAAERIVERTVDELGRLDILVNNSGVALVAPTLATTDEDWDRVIATNLTGSFRFLRAAGRHFVEQRSGKVINIASNLGLAGRAQFAAYCASKAGIVNLTRAVAVEWAPFSVQVNAIAPGYVETDMNAELRSDPELTERLVGRVPAKRMAGPEEVAAVAAFLASPAADHITGEIIAIDGGELAQV